MKIYNTMTRQKEEFVPVDKNEVKIYACGPTVYNYIHIGNARPLCVFDVLRRYLEYRGYKVKFVQNFTDIDDKIIKRANEEGVSYEEISEKYIKEFWTDADGLNFKHATVHPKATENIDEIIDIIKTLVDKGYAYEAGGDVYFRTLKFNEYGKLSHQPIEDLESGARIAIGEVKDDPLDFALWKGAKPGEPYWDSPWGKGRPGWHIECSAMNRKYLGNTIDIHCGGKDLVFPHHENEIAQSEAHNHAPFANYWMHNGFINIDNEKMSKSLGNFVLVHDIIKEIDPDVLRFFMISVHYRSPINYNMELVGAAKSGLERIRNSYQAIEERETIATNIETQDHYIDEINQILDQFETVMNDDFNTANAITAWYDLSKLANKYVLENTTSTKVIARFKEVYQIFSDVLGVPLKASNNDELLDEDVEALIEERNQARQNKDFARADEIRDQLKEQNIILEDTPQGVRFKRG